jgi:hypothetical protein
MAKTRIGTNSQFTGGQLSFSTIGSHIYGFSGTFASSTTAATVLNANTGKGYIVGEFQLNACVATGSPNVGAITGADITFNGVLVARIKADGQAETTPASVTQKVVIPPYTAIQVDVDSDQDQVARLGSVTFVGRVYDA